MLPPDLQHYLTEVAVKLDQATHGQRGAILDEAQALLGCSRQSIYRQLKRHCGWVSARKTRTDKGKMSVSAQSLLALAAASRESVRENGKQTLFTPTARGILEQNGHEFGVSNTQLNRLLRARKLNVKAQQAAHPVQNLRALHPNHVHEVDPSLCLIYYLKGKQHIMRDSEFYKNKLENLAKVKHKVWRYTLYDRASGVIIPWYVEAAGENQYSLFQFLMFAWGKQQGRLFHGVPFVLYWDKGSANTSSAIKNLLNHLEVDYQEHEAGNARAKGGVENANNIIETQFESRLRFEPVQNIAELNQAALLWAEAYNANRLPAQDTRLKRFGLAAPIARQQLWQKISADQLRLLPAIEVCQALMASRETERTVKQDLTITFKHPQATRTLVYSFSGLNGIAVKDKVLIRALVYGDCAIQIQVARYDGDPLTYRVEPERNYDEFGQPLNAAVIGQTFKAPNQSKIEQAAQELDQIAYPGLDRAAIKKARAKQQTPFEGKLNSISYLEAIQHPEYFRQRGHQISTPQHLHTPVPYLALVSIMNRLSRQLKRPLTPSENSWLSARYPDGVPEDKFDNLLERFLNPVALHDGLSPIQEEQCG